MSCSYKPALAGLLTVFCATAQANDTQLFGDSELRQEWADRGIALKAGYTTEIAHNTHGGERRATRTAGQLALGTQIDLDRLWGWRGGKLDAIVTFRHGHNLSDDAFLQTLQQVQEVYGRNQTWRITRLSYTQALFDERLHVTFGRLPVNAHFAAFSCDFMNLTFCGAAPGNIVGHYWYNYPVSQWGLVANVRTSNETYLRVGAYQVNPAYLRTRNAFKLNNPPGTTGVLLPVEFGWTPKDGSYKFGGWYTSAAQEDALGFWQYEPKRRNGAFGAYINLEQQLTYGSGAQPNSGLRSFFNVTQADRGSALVDRQIAMGAVYTGPFASRPMDDIGLALGATHVNSRIAQQQRPHAAWVQRSECTAEVYYTWQAAGWLQLRPNVQYVRHPSGLKVFDDVVIAGLKGNIAF
jgi:porin